MKFLDNAIIAMKNRAAQLKNDERGIDGFVAAIVLVLIVVLLCALLYTFLGDWFSDMWQRIIGATDTIQ